MQSYSSTRNLSPSLSAQQQLQSNTNTRKINGTKKPRSSSNEEQGQGETANRKGEDHHELLGVSVHWLQNEFLKKEVPSDGRYTSDSTIYDIEDLNADEKHHPFGPIRQKGKGVECPLDKKPGAAYVHCLEGADNVGKATHMLSYTWG